ncbi:hypothetical protein CZ797_00415 [Pseudoalteromonas sp. JB197]|nr:hypothetical protein CZ797_00415 [Pseudoalteromonas sp. JB197]
MFTDNLSTVNAPFKRKISISLASKALNKQSCIGAQPPYQAIQADAQ